MKKMISYLTGFFKTSSTKIKDGLHMCRFNKPILSRYTSFESRQIIYQCSCGSKITEEVYRNFSYNFPIETCSGIDHKYFKLVLESDKVFPVLKNYVEVWKQFNENG